ncbi:MAG: hypothetical protein U5L09_22975 [Bacteroidales bacterium]|nr:hypothetical protein [Bacteroidales bacterium]
MINKQDFLPVVKAALAEDFGDGDHTTLATIPQDATGRAHLVAKEAGVIAGIDVARMVFEEVDPNLHFEAFLADGDRVAPGTGGV